MEMPSFYSRISSQDSNHFPSRMVVDNIDVFFTNMYKYYYQRGLAAVLLSQLCSIVSLGFTVGFSIFLVAFVDWNSLMQCRDESSCLNFGAYVVSHPFQHSTRRAVGSLVYILLGLSYWLWKSAESVKEVASAMEMDLLFREKLCISNEELQSLEWDEVLDAVIALHDQRALRLVDKEGLTEHDIVSRIMRKDNYKVAMINKGLLNLRAPWWIAPFVGSDSLILTKSLEWALDWCVLDPMFNEQNGNCMISGEFLRDKQGLAWRFVLVGAAHFLLLPFMLVFMIIHFFLENAHQFHAQRAYLGPRQWSPLSLWTFREFNEMPHVFEERINRSVGPTTEYLALFHNPYLAMLGRLVSYVAGSFVAALLVVSVIDESILLYVNAAEHNLLWYLGMFTAALAGARALMPPNEKGLQLGSGSGKGTPGRDAEQLVTAIAAHTHYKPAEWTDRCHTVNVFNAISEMFPFRVQIFLLEIYSVIITPIVLCFSLPECVDDIIDFVREHTRTVEGVGAVVDYSTFECFAQYGDETFGGPAGSVAASERAVDGKMEKSFVNFHNAHPHWRPKEAGGQAVIDRLNQFRDSQTRAREDRLQEALYQSGLFGPGLGASVAGLAASRSRVGGGVGGGPAPAAGMAGMRRVDSNFSPSGGMGDVKTAAPASTGGAHGEELPPLQRQVSDGLDPPEDASPVSSGLDSGPHSGSGSGPGGRLGVSFDPPGPSLRQRPPSANSPRPTRFARNSSSGFIGGGAQPPLLHRNSSASGLFGRDSGMHQSRGYGYGGSGSGAGGGVSFMGSSSRFPGSMHQSRGPGRSGSGSGTAFSQEELPPGQLNSLLQSVLRAENIDYENDFYWMDMLHQNSAPRDDFPVNASRNAHSVRPSSSSSSSSGYPLRGHGMASMGVGSSSSSFRGGVSTSGPSEGAYSPLKPQGSASSDDDSSSGGAPLNQPLLSGGSRAPRSHSHGLGSPARAHKSRTAGGGGPSTSAVFGSFLGAVGSTLGSQLNVIWEAGNDETSGPEGPQQQRRPPPPPAWQQQQQQPYPPQQRAHPGQSDLFNSDSFPRDRDQTPTHYQQQPPPPVWQQQQPQQPPAQQQFVGAYYKGIHAHDHVQPAQNQNQFGHAVPAAAVPQHYQQQCVPTGAHAGSEAHAPRQIQNLRDQQDHQGFESGHSGLLPAAGPFAAGSSGLSGLSDSGSDSAHPSLLALSEELDGDMQDMRPGPGGGIGAGSSGGMSDSESSVRQPTDVVETERASV